MAGHPDGEDHPNGMPQPRSAAPRSREVVWDPIEGKGGLAFQTTTNQKLVLHTTETPWGWGQSGGWTEADYPYPPHVTVDYGPDGTQRGTWQHVDLRYGAYTLKSGSDCGSANYQLGATWQIEHVGYARDTHDYPDAWYQGVAGEVAYFHLYQGVPLNYPSDWSSAARMTCTEFKNFSGVCGHVHAPPPNTHWDAPFDVDRLRRMVDELIAGEGWQPEGEDDGMILKEGSSGNAVKSLQRSMNNYADANDKGWKVSVDGTWETGSAMTDRLKDFQKSLNLDPTGELDGLTAAYLVGRYDPPKI